MMLYLLQWRTAQGLCSWGAATATAEVLQVYDLNTNIASVAAEVA